MRALAVILAAGLVGCTATTLPGRPSEGKMQERESRRSMSPPVRKDAAEISKSRGEPGGIVVLWPRVIPREQGQGPTDLARALQLRLAELAAEAGGPVDVRPQPERVCARDGGCVGRSLGAVLVQKGDACAAVALVGAPGTSPFRLIPWQGGVEVKSVPLAFRDPPESALKIREFIPCKDMLAALEAGERSSEETSVIEALRRAAGTRPPRGEASSPEPGEAATEEATEEP